MIEIILSNTQDMITELIMNISSKIINVNNYQNCHHGFSLGVSTITQIPSINFVPYPHFSDPNSSLGISPINSMYFRQFFFLAKLHNSP